MRRNALVAQSGGPSPVINSSLRGVIEGCLAFPDRIGTLYAAWHGVEGVLLEELVDVSRQPAREVELLSTTLPQSKPRHTSTRGLSARGLLHCRSGSSRSPSSRLCICRSTTEPAPAPHGWSSASVCPCMVTQYPELPTIDQRRTK